MTSPCDDVRERRFLGAGRNDDAAHLASCEECRAATAVLGQLRRTFATDPVTPPSPVLRTQVLAAAGPLLATKRRHAARHALVAAVAAALLPLPLILMIDLWALSAIYSGLTHLLPPALSFYLVINCAAVLALLGALTYGAIPLLAERQARGRHEAIHG